MNPTLIVVLFFGWLFQSAGPVLATTVIVLVSGFLVVVVVLVIAAVVTGLSTGRSGGFVPAGYSVASSTKPLPVGARGVFPMQAVTKAIIIDEPWISLISSGEKTWEMRKSGCKYRGTVGLIRKGSGQVVGVARIVDSLLPLSTSEAYAAGEPRHRIPEARQEQARRDGWNTPWVLADARPLAEPVSYRHPSGAVIWVNLDPKVTSDIAAQLTVPRETKLIVAATPSSPEPGEPTIRHHQPHPTQPTTLKQPAAAHRGPVASAPAVTSEHRIVTLSGGNIRNNHIYVPLDFFPTNAIGGGNRAETADRQLQVTFRPGRATHADIDGTKRILRDRSATGDFIARAKLKEGDRVVIRRTGAYQYTIEAYS